MDGGGGFSESCGRGYAGCRMSLMATGIKVTDQDGKDHQISLNVFPDKCPACMTPGHPTFVSAAFVHGDRTKAVYAVFRCPISACRALYVATYRNPIEYGTTPVPLTGTPMLRFVEKKEFPKNIVNASAPFCETYNQAFIAEVNGLNQICGPGYRKSLEFLVKDYLVGYKYKDVPEKQEDVKELFLGAAIEKHIDEERIKRCAQRAVWLGNDETHYTRKWVDKDIQDLKSLIMMTVNYIDMTIESDRYLAEMQEPKKL
jgi:hypothetical protein